MKADVATDNMVSIITPIFNSEKYIEQCIASVIKQTHTNWEHLVIDDCSSDSGPLKVKETAKNEKRLKYIRLTKNSGAGIARNKGISLARGKYVAFLDSDDIWHPEKLEKQLKFMIDNDYCFTFTSYGFIDVQGKKIEGEMRAKHTVTYQKALYKNPIGCLTAVYNVEKLGKVFMPEIRKRQDFALWLKLLKKTNAYGLQECLAFYRKGNESISSNKLKLIPYEWKIYRKEEGLSFFESLFYLITASILKLKSYF
ncbi:glycosyltransferase family 2 protein [Flagellimonas lutaonensis]|uniref:Glycosyltransferase, family GT2 n=1 Tax=Flagellimonas lutaonensis TaxID=516051 RepID=A0A0D5YT04_9FLAO|nr:glycosyltransferase family 2 protein [Allomuricauda lutaonensis]AKA34991.1 Glycosyltransferase, family GT2 [Allomuricauda lutaonensis]